LNQNDISATPASYSLWQMIRYMLRLGSLGFGGPIALVGYMHLHRDLVEGTTAAAIGAIAGSAIVIAKRSISDIPTALVAVGGGGAAVEV
jgi:chromate transport protein ChrA